jgi:hypothetical protein
MKLPPVLTNPQKPFSSHLVYARVSEAYDDFIHPYIEKWKYRLNCIDDPFYDSYGDGCLEYIQNGWCGELAKEWANAGVTANEACCACGGGRDEKMPSSAPSISFNPSDSLKPSGNPSFSLKPSSSPKPTTCDTPGWVDAYGDGCDWYEENDQLGCPIYGDCCDGGMGVANDNCCYCAGTGVSLIH